MSGREFTEKDREMALQALEELDAEGCWDYYKDMVKQSSGSPSNDKASIAASAGAGSVEDYQEGKLE